jgi:hypothetical protein
MAVVTLELTRHDFIPGYFEHYEKGYMMVKPHHLKYEVYKVFLIADIVYIYLGQDKHFLKNKI